MSCWNTTEAGRKCDQNVTVKSSAAGQNSSSEASAHVRQHGVPLLSHTSWCLESALLSSSHSSVKSAPGLGETGERRAEAAAAAVPHLSASPLSIIRFPCQPDLATLSPWRAVFPPSFQIFLSTSFPRNGYLGKVTQ